MLFKYSAKAFCVLKAHLVGDIFDFSVCFNKEVFGYLNSVFIEEMMKACSHSVFEKSAKGAFTAFAILCHVIDCEVLIIVPVNQSKGFRYGISVAFVLSTHCVTVVLGQKCIKLS